VACLDNELVDLVQKAPGSARLTQVLEGLKVVAHIIKGAMAQHLADGVVLVDELMQAVIVAVQIEPDHAGRPESSTGSCRGVRWTC